MRSFVFFNNNKVFRNDRIWRIEDIKRKYIYTEISPAAIVEVKTPTGKVLQTGLMVNTHNEKEAIKVYDKLGLK